MKFLLIFVTFFVVFSIHAQSIQYISGRISQDTRWSGQIYIDGDVIVQKGVTLLIDSGSRIVVKAKSDKLQSGNDKDRIELIVMGKLLAKGKPRNARIIFTSDASQQQMNDWYGIIIKNLSETSVLENCVVEYGYKGITCYGSSPVIDGCEIRFNYIAGISCEVRSRPRITNCTIFGNDFTGINCELASFPLVETTSITQNANGIVIFDRSQPDMGHNPAGEEFSKGQNHILNNFEYNIYNHSTNEIYAQNNSWNTDDIAEIEQTNYDEQDNSAYGKILVQPVFGTRKKPFFAQTQPTNQFSSATPLSNSPAQNVANVSSLDTAAGKAGSPFGSSPANPDTGGKILQLPGDTSLLASDNQEQLTLPTIPETVFVVREIKPEETALPKEEFQIEEPVIEGLLDRGKREYIRKVKPEYPKIYKMTGYEGVVYMEVIVAKNGTVKSYRILRSDGEHFTAAAEEAIKKYLYSPGTFRGKPVSYRIIERFKFQLSQ